MKVIAVRNVHEALPRGVDYLVREGNVRETRNGTALVAPGPVTTVYERPLERVLFWKVRDANPFLHFFESLWMLGGRNDVEFLAPFATRMRKYSDDGVTLHGAYGWRWRVWFEFDQLSFIAERLKQDPGDRRQVLVMWDAPHDLWFQKDGKDFPCNTHVYFQRNTYGALDMTVCCRSNDAIWGAYGANAVHFSFLQEYMAARIGCPVGRYWQVSANFHAYLDTLTPIREAMLFAVEAMLNRQNPCEADHYFTGQAKVGPPLVDLDPDEWDKDLKRFLHWVANTNEEGVKLHSTFLIFVAVPLFKAHLRFRDRTDPERFSKALRELESCQASDWYWAAREWIERRQSRVISVERS